MKSRSSSSLCFIATMCAVLFASANESVARQYSRYGNDADGRLVIGFSPTLGINVGIIVEVDGQFAGALTKGHILNTYLAPGRHTLSLYRNGRVFDALHQTLDVRAGETYSFVIKYRVNEVALQRVGRVR